MRKIPLAVPCLGRAEADAAAETVLSGWVTQGPRVAAFEAAFARRVGAAHACAVSSCTTALHLALAGAGVGPGHVVATVSHSFVATANAVRLCGAEPWFVDIGRDGNMSPRALEEALAEAFEPGPDGLYCRHVERLAVGESPLVHHRSGAGGRTGRLAAVLVVHQVGMPADMAAIAAVASAHGLPVVEDAACAIGSELSLDGGATFQPVGRPHSRAACFSFHPRKVLSTGDGGMITTDDPALDARFRLLRQHGMSVPDTVRHAAGEVIFEGYETTAFNYRLTDIQAAVGLEQLKRLDHIVARRRRLGARYAALLAEVPGVEVPVEPARARTNWQSYVIGLPQGADQRGVMQAMQDKGVATRRGIMCAHLEPPYAQAWGPGTLPASEAARDTRIILPLYPDMADDDCDYVVACLKEALSR